jgi:molecular chaperone DnaK
MASDNMSLGRFQLSDVPPSPRGVPQIEVTFDIDANGIINVSAKDKGTGKEQKIKIESGSKLSEEEIERMKNEAKINEEADKEKLKSMQILNEADSMVFQIEKSLTDLGEKISDPDKEAINSLITDIKASRETGDIETIESKMRELGEKMHEITKSIYATDQEPQSEQSDTENSQGSEDFQEAEFEEVK